MIGHPFLHYQGDRVYNPLTDSRVEVGSPEFAALQQLREDPTGVAMLHRPIEQTLLQSLQERGWLVALDADVSREYLLKYVSIETHTVCNHKCYFCPVSVHTRERHFMPWDLFVNITAQLAQNFAGIEGVFLNGYNEPSIDPQFLAQVRLLKTLDLGVAINSNGSGLKPATVDALLGIGGLEYLCINLSTLDPIKFSKDRQAEHLDIILRNLDYMANKPVAKRQQIVVLGEDDADHDQAFTQIKARFDGTDFITIRHKVMSRSGRIDVFQQSEAPHVQLKGCEQSGSRPLQHLHVNAYGQCVLCCQDYFDEYIVGDLRTQSIEEVLSGTKMAQMRRWAYGIEDAPDDFICRNCVFAITA